MKMKQNKDNKQINSHIQMPEFILKRFENEKHELFCYDIKDRNISIGNAGKINTEKGYYSASTEKSLNQKIEQPFSNLLRYIDSIDFNSRGFIVKRGFVEKTRTFLNALLARNPNTLKSMQNNSVYLQLFDSQSQRDIGVATAMNEAERIGFFDKYYPTFTVNKTNQPFVLPICGFYWFYENKIINLPISPRLAITLVDEETLKRLLFNGMIRMYEATKVSEINRLNFFAFQSQFQQGYGMVVSSQKEPLEKILISHWI